MLQVKQLQIRQEDALIIQGISFHVDAGEVVGLIGPNGSGKSTTIEGILGLRPLENGEVSFNRWKYNHEREMPVEMRRLLAYIPEQPLVYTDLTLREHLGLKRRLWSLDEITSRQREEELIERFLLVPHMNKFPHQCSKGTLQKLMVILAFMAPCELLILDEPFVGLDVISIRVLKELMEEVRQAGAHILLSTHVLDSAEKMCDRFLFLYEGKLIAEGKLAELKNLAPGTMAEDLEGLFVAFLRKEGILQ